MNDIAKTGFLNSSELKEIGRYPSEERMSRGPVAVIECCQNIPCNPCETACRFGAITVGDPITNLPVIDENKCIGCGVCITKCPGLAIFLVDKSKKDARVSFPFEYLPLPEKGDMLGIAPRYNGYAGVMGDTIPVSGEYSQAQKDCLNVIREVFRKTRDALKPGECGKTLDPIGAKIYAKHEKCRAADLGTADIWF